MNIIIIVEIMTWTFLCKIHNCSEIKKLICYEFGLTDLKDNDES